ncbi:WD repeat-containing protein 90 [Geodia barretti]|uniref:WD repeat-containing protein 90 n=2 Tax=Geodia barretti TaxID=519541 RepID=A0AA35TGQ1_GEOBA|nr:WD repeat-containing protein 90 [Geodia barretti]
MALSEDGKRLACIGPLSCNISVLDALSLSEVLRLDITPMAPPSPNNSVSSAHLVMFSPATVDQLVVVTSSSEKEGGAALLKFSASNGQLLSQVSRVHRGVCSAISLTGGGRHILTAGDNSIKVWDYSMTLDLNFQVFIGHSEDISRLLITPDGRRIISTAAAIFFWDFLSPPPLPSSPSLPHPSHNTSLLSVSPRIGPPVPTNYEPLKSHQFTPLPSAPLNNENKSVRIALRNVTNTTTGEVGEWRTREEGEGVRGGKCEGVSGEEEESEEGSDDSSEEDEGEEGNEELIIEHSSTDEVHIEVQSGSDQSNLSEPSRDQQAVAARSAPVAERHYRPHPPRSSLATHLYVAPPNQVGVERRAVLGMSGRGRGNVVWQPTTGLFAYSSGCIVVVEDLSNSQQTHLTGHSEEISTLVVRGDGNALASSSHAHDSTPCEIRIWKLPANKCSKVLKFHSHAVTSMAFSRDDRFLLSLGDYHDNSLAVWSTYDYSLGVATSLSLPAHHLLWDPHTAYEFVSVGAGMSLCFWILEEGTGTHTLKVHEAEIPSDLVQGKEKSEVDFTAACYGQNNRLFIGSSIGVVSMWDTSQNQCVMFWKTIPNEIGAMWFSGGKLSVGSVSGSLALWSLGAEEGGRGREKVAPALSVSQETQLQLGSGIFSLSFDQDMKLGVAGCASGCVWYINWSEGTKVKLVCGHAQEVVGVATCSDGELLATACRDGSVRCGT